MHEILSCIAINFSAFAKLFKVDPAQAADRAVGKAQD
jgi:hypothetical protein